MRTIEAARQLEDDIMAVDSEDALVNILREICARMGCAWFAISHHVDFLAAPDRGIRLHNYPEGFAHWFDQNRLGVSDPVHQFSHRRTSGFRWRDMTLHRPRPQDAEVLERARRHNIADGLTVPVHLPGEAHGSVSFAWTESGSMPPEALVFAQSLGAFVFEAARRLGDPVTPGERPQLTDRQIECLMWAARGKSNSVIAQLLDISEETVREHLRNARAAYDAPTRIALAIRALFDSAICFGDVARG